MDFTNVTKKLKELATNDPTLYAFIETRFYPNSVEISTIAYPCLNMRLLVGTPNRDQYPIKTYLFESYYISENSLDESNEIYKRFYAIINNNRYALDAGNMVIREDTGLIDASGTYADKYLYVLTNTWEAKVIES